MRRAISHNKPEDLAQARMTRAQTIAKAGGIQQAILSGELTQFVDITVSEALIMGLIIQGVQSFISVFGHGTTEIGEVLRIYQQAGLVQVHAVRNEIEASHAATALRWVTGEKAAVIASIGPGPLQALAASLVPAANGTGVWYILGDETTEDEGLNFQQIPSQDQGKFLKLHSEMGRSYSLHTPLAISTALRRGLNTVEHPHKAGPFFLLLPMNIQPVLMSGFNLDELPVGAPPSLGPAGHIEPYVEAIEAIKRYQRIVIKIGRGARQAGEEILELLELTDSAGTTAPGVSGVIPYDHPRNMTISGSKGSISGNYAMENAELLIAIGSRFICQADCSRTGYLRAQHVININCDVDAAMHYGKTTALIGDASLTLKKLNQLLLERGINKSQSSPSTWMSKCTEKRQAWIDFKGQRYDHPVLFDDVWQRKVLTQPAAIKAATDWARRNNVISFFDAGDVQANGFQIVEDEHLGQTFTDTGASYMGFAGSALLASAITKKPFYGLAISGDGSFTMNPQILIDGVEHGAQGCILILDNRRMSAISALQMAQYGHDFATNDAVEVDYVTWGMAIKGILALHGGYSVKALLTALDKAKKNSGLSLIHLPVYYGPDELGEIGAFGRWNVGNWSNETQALRHKLGF